MCRIGQFQRRSSRNETVLNMISLVGIFLFMCALVNTASCRSFNENTFTDEEQENDYNEQLDGDDAAFDWQLSTDNVDIYKILYRIDLEEIITFFKNASGNVGDAASVTRRQKRSAIFGRDDRKQISPSLDAEVMPYAASVKISTGCSGTLIGPKYVLTAAHCVYKEWRKKKSKLKVGFLTESGKMRWRKVRKSGVHIPGKWLKPTKKDERAKHDYAVLKLKRNHKRSFMTPVPFHKTQGVQLQFNGFPGDKEPNTMWQTRCNVARNWNGYYLNFCDVARGTSGSGSYLSLHKNNYVVRGLLVASVKLRNRHKSYKFNVVNPLTKEKTRQICEWMKAGKDCKSFN